MTSGLSHPGRTFAACAAGAALLVTLPATPPAAQEAPAPPDAPAAVTIGGGRVALDYDGRTILSGTVGAEGGAIPEYRPLAVAAGTGVTQVLKWTAPDARRVVLDATIATSAEAFAAEADRPADALPIVRYSIGPSRNLRNRAVYDRRRDWVVSIDQGAAVRIDPAGGDGQRQSFRLHASGAEVVLRFRPLFYQRHRGLARFRPWTYQPWERSVAGWTSWFAFRDQVTEDDIRRTATTIAETLAPFGYEYIQIDDGYQRTPVGVPDTWLKTNERFPSGLDSLRRLIADRGLKPGIWTNVSFQQPDYALAHREDFVRAPDGQPAHGNWIGYVMDGSSPPALRDLVRPVYRGLRQMGWQYFKVDALRHLRYEGYNSFAAYFAAKHLDRAMVFRGFAQAIHDEIGPGIFKLACWGVRPELIGLFDGVRIGTDGFGYGGFSQYNSFNNVVWRNDPDHIELAQADAFRATTLTALSGSVLMLTDKPEVYRTERVEAARRAAPVPFARPAQIYDVDPSRSTELARADVEVSGSGPRPFDATQHQAADYLYAVDVGLPFESWMVLARTGAGNATIGFRDVGLPDDRDQYVFEFWTKRLAGRFHGSFVPGAIDPRYGVQVFCIREAAAHPQLLATSRHVTCGAVDLLDVSWADHVLSGQSELVGGDPYDLYLTEPEGYSFVDASADGARVAGADRAGQMRVVHLVAQTSGRASWRVRWSGPGEQAPR